MAQQVVGTRGKIHTSGYDLAGGGLDQNKRTYAEKVIICCDISDIALVYPGYHIDQPGGFVEVPNVSDLLIRTSIEHDGTFHRVLYSGINDGEVLSGVNTLSDTLSINIAAGEEITIWTYVEAPVDGQWSGGILLNTANGEGCAPYGTDYTAAGTGSLVNGVCFNPVAVLGTVTGNQKNTTAFFGDSIFDFPNDVDMRGYMARMFDALEYPYVNFAVRGYSASGFKTDSNHPGISSLCQLINFDRAILDIGGANDFQGAASAESIYDDTLDVHNLLTTVYGISVIANCTIMPLATSSTDGFTSYAGQTMRTQNALRPGFHALLRANTEITVIEVAKIVAINADNSQNDDAERWVNDLTEDGVHPMTATHVLLSEDTGLRTQVLAFVNQSITPTQPILITGRRFSLINPVNDIQLLLNTFDNVFFISDALNSSSDPVAYGDLIAEVPAAKGGALMSASLGTTPRTQILRYNSVLGGLVNLDNENLYYLLTPDDLTITAPCEVHFTGLLTSSFPFEAYLNNIYGLYLGEYGGGLRTTNANDPDSIFPDSGFELYKPFQCRMVFSVEKRVEVYINGVKLSGDKRTYFTGESDFFTGLILGTDTNNAKWFASSIMHVNGLLDSTTALQVYTALKSIYSTEVEIPYPIMKGISVTVVGNNVNAIATYYSPTSVAQGVTTYRWYAAGDDPDAPDVTNNRLITELNDLSTWSKVTFASLIATDVWFRVDIQCADTNGLTFGAYSGSVYYKVN